MWRRDRRSSVESQKYMLRDKIQIIADEYCDTCIFENDYPGWQYRKESPLREKAIALYEKLFDKKAEVAAIHAGLECGYWDNKKPGLDIISTGPNPVSYTHLMNVSQFVIAADYTR